MHTIFAIALLGLTLTAWAAAENYRIDDINSFTNWSVRHIVGKTTGTFTDVKGTLMLDPANPNIGSTNAPSACIHLNPATVRAMCTC